MFQIKQNIIFDKILENFAMRTINDFFIPENNVDCVSEEKYQQATPLICALNAYARITYKSIYVIDYYKKNFLYVSDNPLFLCGLQPDKVRNMGYAFYFDYVPEEEVAMLVEINRAGFKFFSQTTVENRMKLSISCDFHIQTAKKRLLINHKLTPIMLADNGNIWLAACLVSLSSHKEAGNIEARMMGEIDYWTYSLEGRRWQRQGGILLNDREKDILILSSQGYTSDNIADKLCIGVDTIKFDKRKIYNKLNADNISEAISVATNYKML